MNGPRTRKPATVAATPTKSQSQSQSQTRDQRKSTGTEAAEIGKIRFEAVKGAYYHEGLEAHIDRLHRWMLVAVTFLGTATASQLISDCPLGTTVTGLLTTAAGLIDLVFDLSGRARDHGFLKKRFVELNAFCGSESWDTQSLHERLMSIFADEPPQYRLANAVAYNNAQRTLYGKGATDKLLIVPSALYPFRNWWRFENGDFKTASEIEHDEREKQKEKNKRQ